MQRINIAGRYRTANVHPQFEGKMIQIHGGRFYLGRLYNAYNFLGRRLTAMEIASWYNERISENRQHLYGVRMI